MNFEDGVMTQKWRVRNCSLYHYAHLSAAVYLTMNTLHLYTDMLTTLIGTLPSCWCVMGVRM
jgi:hypothetical protein